MKLQNKNIEDITEVVRETFETIENDFTIHVNKLLIKNAGSENWKKEQLASRLKLKNELKELGNDYQKMLEKSNLPTNIDKLTTSAMRYHNSVIYKLKSTVPLFEDVFRQTQIGISKGLPITIQTKSGKTRQYGYKEYMEMKIRTAVQTEISDIQVKTGHPFWICNEFGDCAKDHQKLQGKYYYNEEAEYTDEQKQYIKSHNLMSIQEAKEEPYWLTTRPNCRHAFTPISFEQMTGGITAKELKISKGTFKSTAYLLANEKSRNERNIRFYKARLTNNQEEYKIAPNKILLEAINKDKVLVNKWQAQQRELIKANPSLERNYKRETRNAIFGDLGAEMLAKRII